MALIVFNRPSLTRQVFARIAQAKPAQLFVIADAARANRPGEAALCDQVRAIVTAVDWPCDVQLNFATENMGCRLRVISGLDWIFEQVEAAIILEDDVLPSSSFFPFCEEMLERYRDNDRIAMVSGMSLVADRVANEAESYYFSQLTHIWGWATWRRAWKRYDEHLRHWPEIRDSALLSELLPKKTHREFWTRTFDEMHAGTGPNTWDLQWFYTSLVDSSFSIVPRVNLVENLGFGPGATHTLHPEDNPLPPVGSLTFPLRHPPVVVPRHSLDTVDQDRSGFEVPTLRFRVRNKIRRMLRR